MVALALADISGTFSGSYDGPQAVNVLKVDADEDGVGGHDAADCLRYLVATKSRAVTQRKLRGL